MNEYELGKILQSMYDNGMKNNDGMCQIILFGIIYANEITNGNISAQRIIETTNVPEPHKKYIRDGVRLSKYVTLKKD
jgi:hypothetical protein